MYVVDRYLICPNMRHQMIGHAAEDGDGVCYVRSAAASFSYAS